jgi:cyclophilin family peptidyl-prolyl cis-trans isomerase/HEAT repeat protein
VTGAARASRARTFAVIIAATWCALACNPRAGDARGEGPDDHKGATANRDAALAAVRSAEYSRTASAVSDLALADHDPVIRRAAARALARIGDAASVERLGKSLSDEDDEVVAWAAYGLGSACPVGDVKSVRALVARLTSLEAAPERQQGAPFSARDAIFDALARCGSAPAEATLRAWLHGPDDARSPAALALARLASRQHRLDDASIVALLDAAGASKVHGALAAFGQLDAVSGVIAKRLVEVAERSIRDAGRERAFAISALAPAGEEGVELLSAVLTNEQLPTLTRTRAAVTLGRVGKAAAPALATAVGALAPASESAADARWLDAHFAPLLSTLTALDPEATGKATDALTRVAELAIPNGAAPHVARRVVALRCAASSVLAGSATLSTRLVHCDPDANGRIGALAAVRVLDRGKLAGARRKVWAEYARSSTPGVRRAALSLLPRHMEAVPVVDEVVSALSAKEPGVVAQAARILADAPRLASARAAPDSQGAASETGTMEPSRAIVEALAKAMDAERPPDQIETRVALANAAAGVSALSLKSRLERSCASDNVTVRRAAESSLRALGANVTCTPAKAGAAAPPPLAARPVTLTFVTDAGRFAVTLNPSFAPAAVARVTALAKKGYYDSLPILRVSPAYVVQFGDSTGDGSGGSGDPPLPTEGAPVPFGAFAVGLALGGKDSGSSQVFVTEAEEPALFGDYPLLGSADPEWAQVAEGDVISRVEVHD